MGDVQGFDEWLVSLNESPSEKEGKSDYVLTDSQWKAMPQ